MRRFIFVVFIFLSLSTYSQKAIFVIADGIPADVLESTSTPNINRIIAKGDYVRAHVGGDKDMYSQTPTISAVSYNSLLTGTWVNKHNVWGNDIKAPNYHYPTIFRLFKNQFPQKKIAVYSSWLDNRKKLMGDSLAQTNYLHVDYRADGFELDTLSFPHDKESNYMHLIDERVIAAADSGIRNQAPDLSWVYLEYTDDMGHRYGDSPKMTDAVEKLDKQLGKLYDAIQYRETMYKEKWLLIITTDHGRDEKNGKNHGGQSPRQRSTWIVSNRKLNTYAHLDYPAIVDIMPTLGNFLGIKLPSQFAKEIDGIPLIGKVSVAQLAINVFQQKLDLRWQSLDISGAVKIWLCTKNEFKTGAQDQYILLKEVPNQNNKATIDISQYPSDFYKIALEGKYNTVNKWFVQNAK